MPPMAVFGRRWLVGSDDLAVPFAALTAINTALCVAAASMLMRRASSRLTCR